MTGETLGPYRILDKLGEGGMGVVYRARDPRLARDVAIKVLPESFAGDPQRLRRFVQEARAAGQLNHPNILAVYDVGTHAGAPYLVSELLEGESLRSQLMRGPLSARKAADYARQIAEGLAAAHDKGIVHRDLKPDNLFITGDGRLKILDFGIAKVTSGDEDGDRETILPTETEPGVIVGTAGYMSPEQVRGESVDGRSDLFNVGIVLFEMLIGRSAFRRATAGETMAAILKEDPLADIGTAASPALVRIIARCLEKARDARFQSARDLAFALDVLSSTGEVAAPSGTASPGRRRGLAIGLGAAVLAIVAAAAAWLARADEPRPLENLLANAVLTPLTNLGGSDEDGHISPDGKFIVYTSDVNGPVHVFRHLIGSGIFEDITPGLPDQRNPGNLPAAGFSGNGTDLWLAGGRRDRLRLVPLMGGTPRPFLADGTVNAAWSPDGKQIVSFTFDPPGDILTITDARGGNPRELWRDPNGEHNHFPAWSRDGRWIYFANGSQATAGYDIWRIPSAGGKPERLTNLNTYVRYLTPIDDRTLLYIAPDEDLSGPWLWALDVETKLTRRVSAGLERYVSISADATGNRLVASVANPIAGLWTVPILDRIAEERDVKPYAMPPGRALAPRFGKDSLFYLSSSGARDGLWRLADGKPLEMWKGADGPLAAPASISTEGDMAVSPSREGKRRLMLIPSDGSGPRSLTDAVDVRGVASWSPDSKRIVVAGRDAQGRGLFLIPRDGGLPQLLLRGPYSDPVWSPTDDLIVYSGHQRAGAPLLATRSDGTSVELPPELAVPFGGGGRVRFIPGGKAIVFLRGSIGEQNFWRMDLKTHEIRQLTNFSNSAALFTFDITPDGKSIVFDRLRENADLRLIELKR